MRLTNYFFEAIFVLFAFFVVVGATFVNDYTIADVPVYYFFWLLSILFRFSIKLSLSRQEFLTQFVLLSLLIAPILREIVKGDSFYANGLFFMILYPNIIVLFLHTIRKNVVCVAASFLLHLLAFASLLSLIEDNIRLFFFFGPNLLYRISFFLFAVIFIVKIVSAEIISWKILYPFLLFTISMSATGSRAAVVCWLFFVAIMIILIFRNSLRHRKKKTLLAIMISILVGIVTYLYAKEKASRLFFFNTDNFSEAYRIDALQTTIYFLQEESPLSLLFGLSSINKYFWVYPHNIFSELIVYHGCILTGFFIILCCLFAFKFIKSASVMRITFPFFATFIGSLFSGDMLTNYAVIPVLLYFCFFQDNKNKLS